MNEATLLSIAQQEGHPVYMFTMPTKLNNNFQGYKTHSVELKNFVLIMPAKHFPTSPF